MMDMKIGAASYTNPYEAYKVTNAAGHQKDETAGTGNEHTEDTQILGIGFLPEDSDGVSYGMKCRYADNSTKDNPVIRVEVSRGWGKTDIYNININEIDTHNATEIEMFALCNYADSIGAGTGGAFGSWQTLKYYSINAEENGYMEKDNSYRGFVHSGYDWNRIVERMMQDYAAAGLHKQVLDGKKLLSVCDKKTDLDKLKSFIKDRADERLSSENRAPYSHLADTNGIITYNGVSFVCDNKCGALCLGDMSNPEDILMIPLSGGGCLKVNRNSIGSLSSAIGMFSPKDMGIIMRAIAEDNQCRRNLAELDKMENEDFYHSEAYQKTWDENFKGSAEGVEDAWKKAMEETGVDGFGFDKEGKLTHIPQIILARLTTDSSQPVFGNTVESALRFAGQSLLKIERSLEENTDSDGVRSAKEDEKSFYEAFIENLREYI